MIEDLDSLPFPARELYDHESYKRYFRRYHGYTITSMITSRGCPFECDFCSRPIFERTYRTRSPANIVDEMESIISYGYDRIWIADDIFPINKKLGVKICDEILRRGLDVEWECQCRADLIDKELAAKMKGTGFYRIFFGLESGNDEVLRIMRKRITVEQAKRADYTADYAGIKVRAFFILGYPGETTETMLDTIRFASSLPLDYLSFTVPYPIPGTGLYDKVKDRVVTDDWIKPKHSPLKHTLIFRSDFTSTKLKFGILKGKTQHYIRRHLGGKGYFLIGRPFELLTDYIFKAIR